MKSWNARCALLAAVLAAALLSVAGLALGAGGKGPTRAKILIKGGDLFKRNALIGSNFHFDAGTTIIRSGGTVTLTNKGEDPHTLSIVTHSQEPGTAKQVENCGICGAIAKSHGINPEGPPTTGPPPIPLVNIGAAGFDKPGDSIVIGPKRHGGHVTFKVTARPGTTLNFMCIIHPWMQGRFLVK